MTTATFASDFAFGTQSERINHKILENIFKTPFVRRGGKAIFDFDNIATSPGNTIYAELKTRRINHDDYPTALIGSNKVYYASLNSKSEHWFIYNYKDGIFGIKYDKELFSTFSTSSFTRGERPDISNNPQDTVFIPYKHLIRFS
jgi:hypothetical protein